MQKMSNMKRYALAAKNGPYVRYFRQRRVNGVKRGYSVKLADTAEQAAPMTLGKAIDVLNDLVPESPVLTVVLHPAFAGPNAQ